MPFHIIKVGGSLIDTARELVVALCKKPRLDVLIIPGGGPMADLIRDLSIRHQISDEACHWMAVLAMEQYAHFLADGTDAALTAEIKRPQGLAVLMPYQALQKDDRGIDHSWDYTSDSIAAVVASRLEMDFIKATDVDGIILDGRLVEEISARELMGVETCVDQGTLLILQESRRCCRVLNGSCPEAFISAMERGVGGTLIKG
ncbi:MAG TPA: uridylate kinase [Methanotrichaceae archaeon]|nr:uridylate kinase [Methanotrichaceae archaeon]